MKKAKPEDRLDYWRYHVSAHAFEQARDVCKQLSSINDQHPLFLPLMISLHVLYARPFKGEKETRRIDSSLVPSELTTVHDMLLRMRDRIFAHHDKDSKVIDSETGVDLFQLIVIVNGNQVRPGVQIIYPTDFQRAKVETLCDRLYHLCMMKAQEAFNRCFVTAPADGLYRVSTDFSEKGPLLIRSEISMVQSRGHLKETLRRMPS